MRLETSPRIFWGRYFCSTDLRKDIGKRNFVQREILFQVDRIVDFPKVAMPGKNLPKGALPRLDAIIGM